ncbi:MAG: hypothetical protein Q9192_000971 [Flavoplaca navasiana]
MIGGQKRLTNYVLLGTQRLDRPVFFLLVLDYVKNTPSENASMVDLSNYLDEFDKARAFLSAFFDKFSQAHHGYLGPDDAWERPRGF